MCCEQERHHINKWPVRLAKRLIVEDAYKFLFRQKDDWVADFTLQYNHKKPLSIECKIIAKTAMRSDELYKRTLAEKNLSNYDFVFILIGVNDTYQFADIELYKENLQKIINKAENATNYRLASRIIVLSIPDWVYTPAGQKKETHHSRQNAYKAPSTIKDASNEIKQFNEAIKDVLSRNPKVSFIDITPLTQEFGPRAHMTQADGLHYTHHMTDKWVEQIMAHLENNKYFQKDHPVLKEDRPMRARL